MLRERELQRLMTSSSYAECQMTELLIIAETILSLYDIAVHALCVNLAR